MKCPLYLLGVSLLGVPLACVTSSDTPPPQGDAGSAPYDASLPDAPATDAGALPDAPADASVDAPVDAGQPVVTVRVQRNGGPEAAIPIIFHDAAGAVVEEMATGADGSVARAVSEGAQVSVLLGGAGTGTRQIVTFVGVKNGDVLTVPDDAPEERQVSARVTIPSYDASAFTVRAGRCSTGTSSEASTVDLNVWPSCMGPAGTFPILLEATDGGAPVAYAYKKGNRALGDAGMDDAGTLLVDGVSPWSTTYGSDTIHVPAAVAGSFEVYYEEVADGLAHTMNEYISAGVDTVFSAHRGYADAVQTQLTAYSELGMSSIAIRQDAPSQDATFTIDPLRLLPAVTGVSVDMGSGRATFAWTSESALPATDGVLLTANWTTPTEGGSSVQVVWLVIAPPTASNVVLPQFPPSAAAWTGMDVEPTVYSLAIVEMDGIADYDALRQVVYAGGYTALDPYALSPSGALPPLATNGTLRATFWGVLRD
jgi:hypothetical protein